MEEYITRAEVDRIVKEEVQRQLKEQRQTDEIPAINVNVASQDVITRLDTLKQEMTQELKTVSDTWLETMQEHYNEHHADIIALQESQADLRDTLLEVKRTMATKDDITSIKATQEQILQLLQQKQGE